MVSVLSRLGAIGCLGVPPALQWWSLCITWSGASRRAESSTLIPGLWSCAWAGLSKAACITAEKYKGGRSHEVSRLPEQTAQNPGWIQGAEEQ